MKAIRSKRSFPQAVLAIDMAGVRCDRALCQQKALDALTWPAITADDVQRYIVRERSATFLAASASGLHPRWG